MPMPVQRHLRSGCSVAVRELVSHSDQMVERPVRRRHQPRLRVGRAHEIQRSRLVPARAHTHATSAVCRHSEAWAGSVPTTAQWWREGATCDRCSTSAVAAGPIRHPPICKDRTRYWPPATIIAAPIINGRRILLHHGFNDALAEALCVLRRRHDRHATLVLAQQRPLEPALRLLDPAPLLQNEREAARNEQATGKEGAQGYGQW